MLEQALVHFVVLDYKHPDVPVIAVPRSDWFYYVRYARRLSGYFVRDREPENCPFPRFTFDGYFPSLQCYKILGDSQSQTSAPIIPSDRILRLPEPIEYIGQ